MPLESKEVTLTDLRAIIHALKMATLSFVEQDAVDEVKAMIKGLPGPEELQRLVNTPDAIKNVQNAVGTIMKLIETYGKRDKEYKARYKSRTGLPPRYRVMEWSCAMKTAKNKIVKRMIKASSDLDQKGYGEGAKLWIDCAKKVRNDQLTKSDVDRVEDYYKTKGLKKEAVWSAIETALRGGYVTSINKQIQKALSTYKNDPYSASTLENFVVQLKKIQQEAEQNLNKMPNPQLKQGLQQLINLANGLAAHGDALMGGIKGNIDNFSQIAEQSISTGNLTTPPPAETPEEGSSESTEGGTESATAPSPEGAPSVPMPDVPLPPAAEEAAAAAATEMAAEEAALPPVTKTSTGPIDITNLTRVPHGDLVTLRNSVYNELRRRKQADETGTPVDEYEEGSVPNSRTDVVDIDTLDNLTRQELANAYNAVNKELTRRKKVTQFYTTR